MIGVSQLISVILQPTAYDAVLGGFQFGAGQRLLPTFPKPAGFSRTEPHDVFAKEISALRGASYVEVLGDSVRRFVRREKEQNGSSGHSHSHPFTATHGHSHSHGAAHSHSHSH